MQRNFNPRFPWGKRPGQGAGGDRIVVISIHASRGGSDFISFAAAPVGAPFQSTLPVGEATGEVKDADGVQIISIHASRGGSDFEMTATRFGREIFQSTLPVGEATFHVCFPDFPLDISIHASRGGSDRNPARKSWPQRYFNPRFPWGKRLGSGYTGAGSVPFQSTLPVGEATAALKGVNGTIRISIHASRGGSDAILQQVRKIRFYFNPRFPWGKRLLHDRRNKLLT